MNISTIISFISIILFYSLFWTTIIIIILKAIDNFNEKEGPINEQSNESKKEQEIQLSFNLDDKKNNTGKTTSLPIEKSQKKEEKSKETNKNIEQNKVKVQRNDSEESKLKEQSKSKEISAKSNTIKKENNLSKIYVPKTNEIKKQVTKEKTVKTTYIIDYINETEFRKKERNIKKYNMLAYKKLLFEHYPNMREGKFDGTLIKYNENEQTKKYELILPTDKTFQKVHGNITLHYTVYLEQKTVLLETITPEDILTEGHQKELTTYKGVMVSKSHKDLDMFKINLLNSMNKD